MGTAQLIALGIQIATLAAKSVPAAIEAKEAIDTMLAEGREPTPEEWAKLNAVTDALHAEVQGHG